MGGLACCCGAIMRDVDCPSINIIHVYSESEVLQTLSQDPKITLWDFRSLRRPLEYWYCTECRRVHEVDVHKGRCIRRYAPASRQIDMPCMICIPKDWEAVFIITDLELDAVTEDDFELTLAEYLPKIKRTAMLSPDHKTAIVFDSASGIEIGQYKEEVVR